MQKVKRLVEIVEEKPTHYIIKVVPDGQEVKVGKSFFRTRLECGIFEIVGTRKISTIAP